MTLSRLGHFCSQPPDMQCCSSPCCCTSSGSRARGCCRASPSSASSLGGGLSQTCLLHQTLSDSRATPGMLSQQPQTLGCAATLYLHFGALLTYISALLHTQSALLPARTTTQCTSLAARVCQQKALLAPCLALPATPALQLNICVSPLSAVAQVASCMQFRWPSVPGMPAAIRALWHPQGLRESMLWRSALTALQSLGQWAMERYEVPRSLSLVYTSCSSLCTW